MGGLEGTRREATTSLALDKSWGLTTDRRSRASASRGKEANPTNPGGVEGESGEFIKLTSVAKQNPIKAEAGKHHLYQAVGTLKNTLTTIQS